MEQQGYRKFYRLRKAIPDAKSVEVTFPYEVVDKEARNRGLTVEQFIDQFQVTAEFNGFNGVRYTFIPIELKEDK